jgi:hypothetical protein
MTAMTRPTLFPLPIAGWKEYVSLPNLHIGPIIAKIDTGARSVALHADDIEIRGERVRFIVHGESKRHIHIAPLLAVRRVKSSNGIIEERPVIQTDIQIGRHHVTAEVTLTNRSEMGIAMLLGRAAVRGRFLVHPGKTFVLSKVKKLK